MGWVAGDKDGRPLGGIKTKKFTYSFAVNGGAQGDIALTAQDGAIPNGAIVIRAIADVQTVPTSGGAATIAVKVQAAADANAADAISGAPWSTATPKTLDKLTIADGVLIKLTADRTPVITVGTADLTAGIIVFYFDYIFPADAPLS